MTGFASPNYTQTPNELFDKYLPEIKDLSELKVTMAIIRQTLGYQKKRDPISLSRLQKLTGLSRQAAFEGAEKAVARGLVAIVGRGARGISIYALVIDNDSSLDWSTEETRTGLPSRPTKETLKKKKISPDGGTPPEKTAEKKPRPVNKNAPWHDELLRCFGLTPETVTTTGDKTYWFAAADLVKIQFPVDKIADLHQWCIDQDWPNFTVMALAKHAGEWLADGGEDDDPYANEVFDYS